MHGNFDLHLRSLFSSVVLWPSLDADPALNLKLKEEEKISTKEEEKIIHWF